MDELIARIKQSPAADGEIKEGASGSLLPLCSHERGRGRSHMAVTALSLPSRRVTAAAAGRRRWSGGRSSSSPTSWSSSTWWCGRSPTGSGWAPPLGELPDAVLGPDLPQDGVEHRDLSRCRDQSQDVPGAPALGLLRVGALGPLAQRDLHPALGVDPDDLLVPLDAELRMGMFNNLLWSLFGIEGPWCWSAGPRLRLGDLRPYLEISAVLDLDPARRPDGDPDRSVRGGQDRRRLPFSSSGT